MPVESVNKRRAESCPESLRRESSDFRDHISTADKEGRRKWLYPHQPRGRFYRARTALTWLLLVFMFGGPFVKIHGNPLLMINIVERKFSVLGVIFWPQDNLVFALGFLLFLMGIAVFTAAFGRLWCGWTCPQTVMMEMVFRKIEYLIEGSATEQKALRRAPWSASKLAKKTTKHSIFFALSFIIGNTLLAYIIGIDALKTIITDNPSRHLSGLTFMALFAVVFYALFARFREQACTFICPYGRFQSTLLDENTIVVAYDYKRGEQRGRLRRDETREQRSSRAAGDCIDCFKCVTVCPTGIDIRNGTQMECVNCTACIDACDQVMTKIGRPRGLIRFASLNGIEKGEPVRVTPRIIAYCLILLALSAGLVTLLLTRSDVDVTLLRAPGALFQSTPEGRISNLYLLKMTNKSRREMPVELRLENIDGGLTVLGGELNLPAEKQSEASVLVEIAREKLASGNTSVKVGVYSAGKRLQTIKTIFIGPRR
ncbi:MAG TPA: cytochrome c oxidase accessory protein CcoG [Candidatus Limnocylindrales bacterium]|nr:cytochrome c oxidase accessory protein CcoG [Candidatus Limnocylindrales bacterium]